MPDVVDSGRELLRVYRRDSPELVDLALAVALAVRVEPALLRAARLALVPQLDAGIESDLWFSRLVGSRSAEGIVLDRDVVAALRKELSERKVHGRLGPAIAENDRWLKEARRIVAEAHAGEAPAIRLEEKVIWYSVRGGPTASGDIDRALRSAVKAMVSDPDRGMAVARWADRALQYLPASVANSDLGRVLALGASGRLGHRARTGRGTPAPAVAVGSEWILPADTEQQTVELGVRLYDGLLEFTSPDAVGAVPIELRASDAVLVTVRWVVDEGTVNEQSAAAMPGSVVELSSGRRFVSLHTASGASYELHASTGNRYGLRFSEQAEDSWHELSRDMRDLFHEVSRLLTDNPFAAAEMTAEDVYRYRPDATSPLTLVFRVHRESQPPAVEILDFATDGPATDDARKIIVLSAAAEDYRWLLRLRDHLSPLLENESVAIWSDTPLNLDAGENWRDALEEQVRAADMVVLLMSEHYGNSEFAKERQSAFAKRREQSRPLEIGAVAIGAKLAGKDLSFDNRQAYLNDPSRPLETLPDEDADRSLREIAQAIAARLGLDVPEAAAQAATKPASPDIPRPGTRDHTLALAEVANAIALNFHVGFPDILPKLKSRDELHPILDPSRSMSTEQFQAFRHQNEWLYAGTVQDLYLPSWRELRERMQQHEATSATGSSFSELASACFHYARTAVGKPRKLRNRFDFYFDERYFEEIRDELERAGIDGKVSASGARLRIKREVAVEVLSMYGKRLSDRLPAYDDWPLWESGPPVEDGLRLEAMVAFASAIVEQLAEPGSALKNVKHALLGWMSPDWRRTRDQLSSLGVPGFSGDQDAMAFLATNSRLLMPIIGQAVELSQSETLSLGSIERTTMQLLESEWSADAVLADTGVDNGVKLSIYVRDLPGLFEWSQSRLLEALEARRRPAEAKASA